MSLDKLIDNIKSEYDEHDTLILRNHELKNELKAKFLPIVSSNFGENIWVGAKSSRFFDKGLKPKVISYYTKNTSYQDCAMELKSSLDTIGYDNYLIHGVDSAGDWEVNCSLKPEFILNTLKETKGPVLWVDADAKVKRAPLIPHYVDFGVHLYDDWEFASGTLFFNYTENAIELLKNWTFLSKIKPLIWDQMLLDQAWCEVSTSSPLITCWLPNSYTYIFDQKNCISAPHIIHYQESRTQTKKKKPNFSNRLVSSRKNNIANEERFDILPTGTSIDDYTWPDIILDLNILIDRLYSIKGGSGKRFEFIQVGAMDGKRFDPLHKHIKAKNLKGILLEPNKEMFDLLVENYRAYDQLTLINAAIHNEEKIILNRIPRDVIENEILPEWALGISSIYTDRNALGGKQVDNETLSLIQKYMVSEEVDCVTLESLISEYNISELDLLQVDTEGHDWQVLSSFPIKKIKPMIINFEYYNLPKDEQLEAQQWLIDHGYAFTKDHKDITATLLRLPK